VVNQAWLERLSRPDRHAGTEFLHDERSMFRATTSPSARSDRGQFDPTDRAGGIDGLEPVMPGIDGVVGLPSRAGAPGNRTGSRTDRSLPRSPPVHPETKNRVAVTAARPNVVFISQLLRE